MTRFLILLGSCALSACQAPQQRVDATTPQNLYFEALTYRVPGATADLGVGLWAWPLPMDYDQDGDLDLVVSCPDVPYKGTYLFENPTGEAFPNFKAPVKIGAGFKNIQVSQVEDSFQVMVGEILYRDFLKTHFQNGVTLFSSDSLEAQHQKIRFKQYYRVDYDGDGDLDLIVGMDDWGDYGWDNAYDTLGNWTNGPLHGYVYWIENEAGTLRLKGKVLAGGQAIDVYGAPSPNFADFDGDGDLDIICGEFLDKLTWFENIGSRTQPRYATGRLLEHNTGIIHMDLQMIIPTAIDWDQDGDVDLLVGDEDGRVAWIENTGKIQQSMPVFEEPRYFRQEGDKVKFGALVTPVSVDWDGDGDEDIVCGNTAGYIGFIENLGGGVSPKWAEPTYLHAGDSPIRIQAGSNGSIQGPCEAKWGYTTLSVADWDGDQLLDLIVNSIWGKVLWYKNEGSPGNPIFTSSQAVQVSWEGLPPKPEWTWWTPGEEELATQWRTSPVAIDWNRDSLMDLVMLDHEGYLAFFERFEKEGAYPLKPGQRIFFGTGPAAFASRQQVVDSLPGPLRLNANPNGSSGRRKFCFVDWDQDGDQDLLVNSVNVSWLENVKTDAGKTYFTDRGPLSDQKLAGHTTSPTVVDWNQDGKPEILLGAEDGFLYYGHQQR